MSELKAVTGQEALEAIQQMLEEYDEETKKVTDEETKKVTDEETKKVTDEETKKVTDKETKKVTNEETTKVTEEEREKQGDYWMLKIKNQAAIIQRDHEEKFLNKQDKKNIPWIHKFQKSQFKEVQLKSHMIVKKYDNVTVIIVKQEEMCFTTWNEKAKAEVTISLKEPNPLTSSDESVRSNSQNEPAGPADMMNKKKMIKKRKTTTNGRKKDKQSKKRKETPEEENNEEGMEGLETTLQDVHLKVVEAYSPSNPEITDSSGQSSMEYIPTPIRRDMNKITLEEIEATTIGDESMDTTSETLDVIDQLAQEAIDSAKTEEERNQQTIMMLNMVVEQVEKGEKLPWEQQENDEMINKVIIAEVEQVNDGTKNATEDEEEPFNLRMEITSEEEEPYSPTGTIKLITVTSGEETPNKMPPKKKTLKKRKKTNKKQSLQHPTAHEETKPKAKTNVEKVEEKLAWNPAFPPNAGQHQEPWPVILITAVSATQAAAVLEPMHCASSIIWFAERKLKVDQNTMFHIERTFEMFKSIYQHERLNAKTTYGTDNPQLYNRKPPLEQGQMRQWIAIDDHFIIQDVKIVSGRIQIIEIQPFRPTTRVQKIGLFKKWRVDDKPNQNLAFHSTMRPFTVKNDKQEDSDEEDDDYEIEPEKRRYESRAGERETRDKLADFNSELQDRLQWILRQAGQNRLNTFLDNRLYIVQISVISGRGKNAFARNAYTVMDVQPFDPLTIKFWTEQPEPNNTESALRTSALAVEMEKFVRFSTYVTNEEAREGIVEKVHETEWSINGPNVTLNMTTRQLDHSKTIRWKQLARVQVEFSREGEQLLHPLLGHVMDVEMVNGVPQQKTVVFNELNTMHLIINSIPKQDDMEIKVHLPSNKKVYQRQANLLQKQWKAALESTNSLQLRLQKTYFGRKLHARQPATTLSPEDAEAMHQTLNNEQYNALNQILQTAESPVQIITAPGGCGKSTLIAGVLEARLRCNQTGLLIATSSNAAADAVMEKAIATHNRLLLVDNQRRETPVNKNKILRHYNQHRIMFDLAPHYEHSTTAAMESLSTDYCVELRAQREHLKQQIQAGFQMDRDAMKQVKEDLFRKMKKIKEINKELMEQVMKQLKPSLIVCTIAGLEGDDLSMGFQHAIIDESSMMNKVDLATIYQKLNTEPTYQTTILIVGDPEQLPPMNQLPQNHPTNSYSSISALAMMIRLQTFPLIQLFDNYRANFDITELVGHLFYGGSLHCCNNTPNIPQTIIPTWQGLAVKMVAVESPDEPAGRGYRNRGEAWVVLSLCNHLLNLGAQPDQIHIISPYDGQVKLLRQGGITCGPIETSDSYQGKEADIIILSTVRSPRTTAEAGFFTKQRMCVALTRAKRIMLVVSSPALMTLQPQMAELARCLRSRNELIHDTELNDRFGKMYPAPQFQSHH